MLITKHYKCGYWLIYYPNYCITFLCINKKDYHKRNPKRKEKRNSTYVQHKDIVIYLLVTFMDHHLIMS